MHSVETKLRDFFEFQIPEAKNFTAGWLVEITEEGQVFVNYPGNLTNRMEARLIISDATLQCARESNVPVLLVFENGDPALPIIVGIIRDKLPAETAIPFDLKKKDILLDGKKLVFDAKEEIELRCGKSSVILKKNGKIVLKGVDVVSRASRTNKIKGASVKIN